MRWVGCERMLGALSRIMEDGLHRSPGHVDPVEEPAVPMIPVGVLHTKNLPIAVGGFERGIIAQGRVLFGRQSPVNDPRSSNG